MKKLTTTGLIALMLTAPLAAHADDKAKTKCRDAVYSSIVSMPFIMGIIAPIVDSEVCSKK